MNACKKATILLLSTIFIHSAFGQDTKIASYNFNRAPLKQKVDVQLPLGSIKPKGWLLIQLQLQKEGFTGHAEELYPEKDNLGKDADWLGGSGNSWEKAPYYLKGLVALAYTLDDADLKHKAQKWIDFNLANQRKDGLFGPSKMKDWWPRMPFMYALQSYYEATQDQRVIPFLLAYFKYQLSNLDHDPLKEWGKARAGDNMEIALWVYNQTGEKFLLELVNKLKNQAYPWADIFNHNRFFYYGADFHPKHMVNVAQALKFPAIYSQVDSSGYYSNAPQKGVLHIMREHGLPQGLGAGTEFLSGNSSIQGVETCTVVEWMQSLETASRIIQDAHLGDQLEKIAFNALPAQFSKDLKSHTYYTLPNQVQSVIGPHGFNQDYTNSIVPSPYSGFPCCRYNMHMGWPYFIKNSWMASLDGGLVVNTYGPMEVNALVNHTIPIAIEEDTNYPFEDQVRLTIKLKKSSTFPLRFRIPGWCSAPEVLINGRKLPGVKAGEMFVVDRNWTNNDKLILNFPSRVVATSQVNNGVSIERGPLVFSLQIKEEKRDLKEFPVKGFYETEITPTSPWNYGLVLTGKSIEDDFVVVKGKMPENPFLQGVAPVQLMSKAKRIPSWTLDYKKTAAFDVPYSPVNSNEKTEDITLVPFGSGSLRLSVFPTIGEPAFITEKYQEDFSNNSAKGLVIYGGAWFFRDNAIQTAPNENGRTGEGTKVIATGTKFSNFVYSADITVDTPGDAGLVFRVNRPAIGAEAYEGYYLGLNPGKKTIQLGKSTNGKWEVISSINYPLESKELYKLKIKAQGSRMEVFIDGREKPVLVAVDNEFKEGSIGMRAYNAIAKVDNLEVISLK